MNTQTWTRNLQDERALLVQERIKEWREYYAIVRSLKAQQKAQAGLIPFASLLEGIRSHQDEIAALFDARLRNL